MNTIDILDNKTIFAGCEDGYLQVSTDAGLSWTASKISDQSINDINVSTSCDWWVAGDEGYIAYSSNLGKTWNKILTSSDEDLLNIKINKDCTEAWACGDDGTLVHLYESRLVKPLSITNTDDTNDEDDEKDDSENEISWETRALKHAQKQYLPLDNKDTLFQGIDLEISPEGSTAKIDKQTYTGTQLKIPLPPGKHSYCVTKMGYFTIRDSFDIPIGETKEEDIKLKKIKVLISPSGGFSFIPNNSGLIPALNFSLMSGVLTNNHICSGFEFDGNIPLLQETKLASITIFGGYSSNPYKKFTFLPTFAIGGTNWLETRDSLKSDTISTPDYSKHKDSVEYTVSDIYFTLQASLNFIANKSNRWGFIWRPSLFWVNQKGFHFVMRFGGIVWI